MAHLSSTANEGLLYGGIALGVILVLIGCGNLFLPEDEYVVCNAFKSSFQRKM
ncbi:hypothetical protein BVRB_2g043430 [Beta vulgaris subsp. vulgaris]|nr:hypothetical protein BVRB_2g043430 [Beta vulgaris subsp. vulgaris]